MVNPLMLVQKSPVQQGLSVQQHTWMTSVNPFGKGSEKPCLPLEN